uniref:Glycosyltransferase 2-like domain-containing protein n=2 Tax=Parascaris univalens TaxID=6257 RepID=A0A915AX99_PARUN
MKRRYLFALLHIRFSLIYLTYADETSTNETTTLPRCPHIDPYIDMEAWSKVDANATQCNHLTPKPLESIENAKELERYRWGERKFAFDILASDKIGPRRYLQPMYHQLCSNISYDNVSLDTSIIIIYHNEALSVLVRMLNSILDRTPSNLLKEIILYDDFSDEDAILIDHLLKYATIERWPIEKFIIKRSNERLGLIRAKTYAARLASADVLVFLDSHCEVTDRWIQPLLAQIQEDNTRVVIPLVDLISPVKFDYEKAMVTKSAFDWGLNFVWKYFKWEYFDIPENNIKPFKSPIMSGGLLAIERKFFHEMGEYDTSMEIWGAENIEMSVRMWLCGGSILVVPCSRVGHVFRVRRPYKGKPDMADENLFNSLRTVKVWFDEYEKYFYKARPNAIGINAGDLSERFELKRRLRCKPFSWYINEIYPELRPSNENHDEL